MRTIKQIAEGFASGKIRTDEKFTLEARTIAQCHSVLSLRDNEIKALKFEIAKLELEAIGSKQNHELIVWA